MPASDRPSVSRRHLVRALLGREIPPPGANGREPAADPHAAGDAAFTAGDWAGAVAAYRASVRGDLSNIAVRARLGYALYVLGQFIQARVEFEHVLRLTEGGDALARLGLALTFLGLGKPARAATVLADFADPGYPDLVARAQATAEALVADEACDPAAARLELDRLARGAGLFPETA